ncbi:MAG: hypothetical protein ACLQVL_26055 [Terriglobia bacterium]
MLSGRLVRMVEDHADQLARGVVVDLQDDPRTSEYHRLSPAELHTRIHDIYHNLGEWLVGEAGPLVEARYSGLGKQRAAEGIPLSQVVYALMQSKSHLFDYIRSARGFESAIEMYELQELRHLIDNFFDRAMYHTVCAYERQQVPARV